MNAHRHTHAHDHSHDHAHGPHSHAPDVTADNARRVAVAMVLTGGYMVAEIIGGLLSGSLALIADAGHMATDTASLILAFIAFRLARRPADPTRSYGYHRAEILAAFVNALAMMALVAWILYEAVERFLEPVEILGGVMLWVALGGLLVNILAFAVLHTGDRENLNMRGAAVHVLGDLLGSVAAIGAALVILYTGWTPIDPILSVFVGLLVLRSAWAIARESAHILMEGTPSELNISEVAADLKANVRGVEDVHHVHAWSLTATRIMMTLHARLENGADGDTVLEAIQVRLAERFNVEHATVQLENGTLSACCD